MTIAIGGDHAGYQVKEYIKEHMATADYQFQDFGTNSEDSVDYPDYVHPLSQAIEKGEYELGILICGSGNGVAMTANKYPHVRAALCWTPELASLARQHNNANVIAIPARFVAKEVAQDMVKTFLTTPFEGGRHERRVGKISADLRC